MDLFKNAIFNYSWEIKSEISLLGVKFPLTVSADAYYATEKPTSEQEASYGFFLSNYKEILEKIEEMLVYDAGSVEGARRRYIPKMIKIKKNGDCGLLLDDADDFENGLVVTIRPSYELMSTDEYL